MAEPNHSPPLSEGAEPHLTDLARVSPFIIEKIIDYNVHGEVKDVKRLASGDLRVETFKE